MRNPSLLLSVLSVLLCSADPASADSAANQPADPAMDKAQRAADKAQRAADKAQQAADKAVDKAKVAARKAGSETSDSWLTAKTKLALYADSRVSGGQIDVLTNKAVVTLRGKVDAESAKKAASEVAQGIDGVKDVKNELMIVPAAQRKMVEAKDDYIVSTVKDRLGKDKRFKDANIDVRSDAGVVTLSGEVPSLMTSASASEVAFAVTGVRSVNNTLTTK